MQLFRLTVLPATLVALLFFGAHTASAGKIKTVVELYTSQGCSSCPPADALIESYVKRPDVLALTMPVDYWDYLGWKDTYAKRAYSTRQRLYATTRGDGQVYTPQVVVNGMAHAVGSRHNQIEKAIAATNAALANRRIDATLTKENGNLVVRAENAAAKARINHRVWLAHIQKKGTVRIRRGENGGRKLTYFNIVRQMSPVGTWKGEDMVIRMPTAKAKAKNEYSYAVIFQDGLAGAIVGAAELSAE